MSRACGCSCPDHDEIITIELEDNIPLGIHLGRVGMNRAIANADEQWKGQFRMALSRRALSGRPFTSEDVVSDIGGLPQEGGSLGNNVVGALMNSAARRGVIIKTGAHHVSRSPRSHGRELREWVGAL